MKRVHARDFSDFSEFLYLWEDEDERENVLVDL